MATKKSDAGIIRKIFISFYKNMIDKMYILEYNMY